MLTPPVTLSRHRKGTSCFWCVITWFIDDPGGGMWPHRRNEQKQPSFLMTQSLWFELSFGRFPPLLSYQLNLSAHICSWDLHQCIGGQHIHPDGVAVLPVSPARCPLPTCRFATVFAIGHEIRPSHTFATSFLANISHCSRYTLCWADCSMPAVLCCCAY